MVIGADYPTPVYVNGYACNNCAQVAEARKDINPADPQAGPGGVDANSTANSTAKSGSNPVQSPAFILGGVLASNAAPGATAPGQATASPSSTSAGAPTPASSPPPGLGGRLDISI